MCGWRRPGAGGYLPVFCCFITRAHDMKTPVLASCILLLSCFMIVQNIKIIIHIQCNTEPRQLKVCPFPQSGPLSSVQIVIIVILISGDVIKDQHAFPHSQCSCYEETHANTIHHLNIHVCDTFSFDSAPTCISK